MAAEDLLIFLKLFFNAAWLWLVVLSLLTLQLFNYFKARMNKPWEPYDQLLSSGRHPRMKAYEELRFLKENLDSSTDEGKVMIVRTELSKILAERIGVNDREFLAIRNDPEKLKQYFPDKNIRLFLNQPKLWYNSHMRKQGFFSRISHQSNIDGALIDIIKKVSLFYPMEAKS